MEEKKITWQDLKDFVDNIPKEFMNQPVTLNRFTDIEITSVELAKEKEILTGFDEENDDEVYLPEGTPIIYIHYK